jgi:HPt (histidine-containing phosphotransfer) domain-containing protein
LLLDFGTTYQGAAAEIRKALDLKDMDQAHSLVHNLKGLAGNLAAIDLQAAAIEMEKLVKPEARKDRLSAENLNLTFSKLEAALNDTLQSVQTLGSSSFPPTPQPSEDIATALPLELAKDAARGILDAAEMGDVSRLKTIAEGLITEAKAFSPFSKKMIHLAEEFDFDGIVKLVDEIMDSK